MLKAAPKAKAATIQRLSRPRNTRSPTDACTYADYKAAQLGKQRAAHEQRQREEAAYEAARQEALQGWLRAKEQVSLEEAPAQPQSACIPAAQHRARPGCGMQEQRRAAVQYQQQLQAAEEAARASAGTVTRAAMSNLAALKQQLEQQKQQAALAGQQATTQQRRQGLLQHTGGGAGCQQLPVQPVLSYIKGFISTDVPGR